MGACLSAFFLYYKWFGMRERESCAKWKGKNVRHMKTQVVFFFAYHAVCKKIFKKTITSVKSTATLIRKRPNGMEIFPTKYQLKFNTTRTRN